MSPTARSKQALRDKGWVPWVVERRIPRTNITVDLFGFADILAMKPGEIPVLVQTTDGTNFAARRKKILASDLAAVALQSGFRIVLHGWSLRKVKKGGKAVVWTCREEEITIDQFE